MLYGVAGVQGVRTINHLTLVDTNGTATDRDYEDFFDSSMLMMQAIKV